MVRDSSAETLIAEIKKQIVVIKNIFGLFIARLHSCLWIFLISLTPTGQIT